MQSVLVLAVLLGLVASGHALECYQCKGKDASTVIEHGGTVGSEAGLCSDFKETDTFKKTCPDAYSKSCLKVTKDDGVLRGCANVDKTTCEEDNKVCYCKDDKCNGSSRGWPSAMLLLAALTAALVGSRR